jgi:hypothetical protein
MMMLRTTVTLDDDTAEYLRIIMSEASVGFKEAINMTLRLGFEARRARKRTAPYSAPTFDLGRTMPSINIDCIPETLEFLEGPMHP